MRDRTHWRISARRAAFALTVSLPFAYAAAADAQSFMRTPSINTPSRMPIINPTVASRINPNIAGRGNLGTMRPTGRISGRPLLPYARYSPNLNSSCSYAYRNSDGECSEKPVITVESNGGGKGGKGGKTDKTARSKGGDPKSAAALTALPQNTVNNELVAEIDGSLSSAQADQLARRHGLERIASQNFQLTGGTFGLFRIIDRRAPDVVSRELAADTNVLSVQMNYRYVLQQQKVALTEGDPAQYALAKLRLPEAHKLADGINVTIAVIDSGIDAKHPELVNAIADTYDALGSKEGPHVHGTGIAGAIVSHGRLMGSAPAAKILAIRAFGTAKNGAESNSFVILKGLEYAAAHGAQIINMSFAGPKDPLIDRGIAATAAKGILMVAAGGNAGPKSPPLYPAANANVIAVSGTDAQDKLFAPSNRGSHIAVAAPGADIFLPAPDEKYQMTSGTSFSAAFVTGVAALMLERNPALKPDEVREILMKTARDLGVPGRDEMFGAGEADAFAAVSAVIAQAAVPVAAAPAAPMAVAAPATAAPSVPVASGPPASEKVSIQQDTPTTRALNEPVAAAMASDKPAVDAAIGSAER